MEEIVWNPQTGEFGKEREVEATAQPGKPPQEAPAPLASSAASALEQQKRAELGKGEMITPYGSVGFNLAHAIENRTGHAATEWLFILISLVAAGAGVGLGWLFYVKDTSLPDLWARKIRPLYEASYNKYWVDEFYGWAITRRTMDLARGVFAFDSKVVDGGVNGSAWLTRLSSRITGGIDKYFVDGLVNAIAAFIVRLMSPLIRSVQTGLAQNYALVMVLGLLVAVVVLFLWK
jgi:NADH-quinone oxidoreductase subunit L